MISNMAVPMRQFPAMMNTSIPNTLMPYGGSCCYSGEPLKFTFHFGRQIGLGNLIIIIKFCLHRMFMEKYFPNKKFPKWEKMLVGWLIDMTSLVFLVTAVFS